MFKQFSNRSLALALLILLGLYGLSLLFGGRSSRSFKRELARVDSARVSRLILTAPEETVELRREGAAWKLALPGGVPANADERLVAQALSLLRQLDAAQVLSQDPAAWPQWQLDSSGLRVQAFAGEEPLADLIVGRFEYKQSGIMSYVRLSGQEAAYLVRGSLASSLRRGCDDWRDKRLASSPPGGWRELRFRYPGGESFALLRGEDQRWRLADSTLLDEGAVVRYLGGLGALNGRLFCPPPASSRLPTYQAELIGGTLPLLLSAYADSTGFLLSSTLNPGVAFCDPDSALFRRAFPERAALLGQP
jgi:hypothetical protein